MIDDKLAESFLLVQQINIVSPPCCAVVQVTWEKCPLVNCCYVWTQLVVVTSHVDIHHFLLLCSSSLYAQVVVFSSCTLVEILLKADESWRAKLVLNEIEVSDCFFRIISPWLNSIYVFSSCSFIKILKDDVVMISLNLRIRFDEVDGPKIPRRKTGFSFISMT